jgi:CheY-like chemotaxis protein
MQQYNCLVLEDSLTDQLSIEMLLNQYPQIKPFYASTSQDFEAAMSRHQFNLIITDIKLQSIASGIDLIKPLKDASIWVIICSAYNCKKYYEQYRSFPFTKFYIQKPFDEFIFKTYIDSFLFTQNKSYKSVA